MKPEISIIMPVYNAEKYVANTIESILKQTFINFELIIIDDGSKDSSGKICDGFALRDNRITVVHKKNGGICEARNKGLEVAKGKYIMFSDNDDIIESNLIEDNYKLAIKNNADIVKFGRKTIYLNEEKIYRTNITRYFFKILQGKEIKEKKIDLIFDKALVCVWDGIYKKEIVVKFDTDFKKGGEDIDFNLKIFDKAKKIVLNDKVYYNHYIRKGFSTSTKFDENKIYITNKLLKLFKETCEDEKYNNPEKYNIIQIRDYLNAILVSFNNKENKLETRKRISVIKNMEFDFLKIKLIKMLKLSNKYTLEYVLFKLKLYNILYILLKLKK